MKFNLTLFTFTLVNVITKSRFQDISMWAMGSNWFGTPQLFVYSYLIDGLLIDTGHPNIQKQFLDALDSESIDKCVITHHHEDHSGNANALQRKMDVEIFASPKCVNILRNPPRVSPIQHTTWGQNEKVELTSLDLESIVKTKKYTFDIIETPGHAEDMICLFESNEGWLFSGDNFVNTFINVFMDNENISEQIESLKKILRLDFDVLLCSHYPQFRNGKAHIRSKLNFLLDFYGRVSEEYQKGSDESEILKALEMKKWGIARILSLGKLSQVNMVRSVVRSLNVT
ncbi:MAG: MBL fold metallo-hydrolase [Saprospiraceae bacterium]|nr:MBL fold metallo-hydrolase [Saprospiraceae bacterium]